MLNDSMHPNSTFHPIGRWFLLAAAFLSTMLPPQPIQAQDHRSDPRAYAIFNSKGKSSNYHDLLKEAEDADIVLFGELHNNPICHWLQLELTRDLYSRKGERLLLGAEMFESDNQIQVNEYFLGHISEKSFESETRLWGNYKTDYKPLLDFAKENSLRWVATNVPRRYASLVFKEGLDKLQELPDYSKIYLAPLPIAVDMDVNCYQKMLTMSNGDPNFPQAQMIKDATMAHFILRNWNEGELFLHYNGAFHSDYREGIVWYLRQQNANLRVVVISTVEQDDLRDLDPEHRLKGDFIFVIPNRMTKTH